MLLLICYLPLISVPTVRIPDKEDQDEDEDEDDNVEVSADGKHEDATQHNYHPLKAGGSGGLYQVYRPKQDLILLQIGLWLAL